MGEVIVITSGKGGVGKTTTTANLGSSLALEGKKVALVDTDIGLRNLDVVMGLENRIVYDIVDVVEEKCKLRQALIKDKRFKELYLLPAAQTRDKSAVNEEQMRELTSKLKEEFDYILIDCMPSLGMITLNALTAADSVIIPVQAQYLPAKGMTQLLATIAKVKKHTNPNLHIDGVLLTLVDGRTNLAKSTVETLRNHFGSYIKIYKTSIPIAVKAAEVSSKGKSIYAYEPNSIVSKAYADFTREVLADDRKKERLHVTHEYAR